MVEELVCGNCVEDADIKCVEGKCACCGFGKYWSKGLRPKLVGADHHLLDGVSNVWETCIRWETLRSSTNTPSDGSNTDEKETLRAQRSGTIIEFLDKFEEISAQFPAHRHLVCDAKAKALRRFRYCWPGMLLATTIGARMASSTQNTRFNLSIGLSLPTPFPSRSPPFSSLMYG